MFARTDRLMLRPSWPEDAETLHSNMADEAIIRNLASAPWPYEAEDAREFVSRDHEFQYPNFLLFQRTDGAPRLIGSCGLGKRDGEAELGYWIARPYWGLGYASEAARAVVQIAATIGHSHLNAGHFTDNPASGNVLRKAGFHSTGRTEMRYSKGRSGMARSVLFRRTLPTGAELGNDMGTDLGGDIADKNDMRCEIMMPYDAQLIAA